MRFVMLPVIVLLAAAGLVGTIAILRTRRGSAEKSLYIILRLLQTLLLITAFTQPVITCNRLASGENTTAILVDVSRSMSQFTIRSAVNRIDSLTLRSVSDRSRQRPVFAWYLFGDSLREWNRKDSLQTTDRGSLFPSARRSTSFPRASDCIIISDGAWSNADAARAASGSQTFWYLPLERDSAHSYLSCRFPDSLASQTDGTVAFTVELSGYHRGEGFIVNIVNEKTIDTVRIADGYFSETLHTAFTSPGKGYHLVPIRSFFGDTPSSGVESHLLVHDTPRRFTYSVKASTPSLDIRFLKSALREDSSFVDVSEAGDGTPDATIIADTSFDSLPGQGTLLLLGGLRGTHHRTILTDSGSFTTGMFYSVNPFASLNTSRLPPVRAMTAASADGIQPMLSSINRNDTLSIIYKCTSGHRPALVCGIIGFWKWDFLPLAHDAGETDKFQFSRRLVSALHGMLLSQCNDTFLVYPQDISTEGIDISLTALLPSAMRTEPDTVDCTITDTSGAVVADTRTAAPPYSTAIAITLPPLREGRYHLLSRMTTDRTQRCSIPLRVHENVTEYTVRRQNDQFLDEIGQRLDLDDPKQAELFISEPMHSYVKQHTSRQQFPIRQGWLLFGLLAASLLLEWALRKAHDHD